MILLYLPVKYLMTITIYEEVNNAALISYRAVKTDQNTSYIPSWAMLSMDTDSINIYQTKKYHMNTEHVLAEIILSQVHRDHKSQEMFSCRNFPGI